MSFRYDSEFVFIGRGDESFLESYTYEHQEDAKDSGRLFFAVEILNNQSEAQEIGDALFHAFKMGFGQHKDKEPYDRFEESLKQVNIAIQGFKQEKVSGFIGNLNMSVGAVIDGTLYISITGEAEVYLIRKRFISLVSDGLADEASLDSFVNIANGGLEAGDTILFATSRLLRYISKAELGGMFDGVRGLALGDAMTDLQDFVATEILGRCLAIGVSVSDITKREDDEVPIVYHDADGVMSKIQQIAESVAKLLPKTGGSGTLSSIKQSIAQLLSPKKDESKKITIHWRRSITKERTLTAIILLVVLLIGGVFWYRTRGSQQKIVLEQQSKLNAVREVIDSATTAGQFDKAKAAELLESGEKSAFEVLNSRYLRSEAVQVLDSIKKLRDGLDDIRRIEAPVVVANLADKRGSVNALGLLSLKEKLFAFEYNALYEMILDKLQDPQTISNLETVILGAEFEDNNALLFMTRTGKMIEYADSNFSVITTRDGIWKKGVDFKTYGDRIYVLDPERNQIWRYTQQRGGFTGAEEYNKDAELQNGVSLAIDGFIYVLNSDGTITELYQGQREQYPLKKLPLVAVEKPTRIYTSTDLGYLYILEPSKQRVVLFKKDPANGGAVYRTQYVFENVGELRDVIVKDDRMYVADASKVYVVNLSEL